MSEEDEFSLDSAQPLPFYELLNMKISEISKGKAILEMTLKDEMKIPGGVMYGGAIASIADSAVAIALFSLVGQDTKVATIDLNINYLEPVRSDITAKAEIIHKGSKIATGEVEITDEENKTVAKANANYAIIG